MCTHISRPSTHWWTKMGTFNDQTVKSQKCHIVSRNWFNRFIDESFCKWFFNSIYIHSQAQINQLRDTMCNLWLLTVPSLDVFDKHVLCSIGLCSYWIRDPFAKWFPNMNHNSDEFWMQKLGLIKWNQSEILFIFFIFQIHLDRLGSPFLNEWCLWNYSLN